MPGMAARGQRPGAGDGGDGGESVGLTPVPGCARALLVGTGWPPVRKYAEVFSRLATSGRMLYPWIMDWPTILTLGGTIIATGLSLGIGLVAVIVPGQRELRRDVGELRERMARIEGLFEGFTGKAGQKDA